MSCIQTLSELEAQTPVHEVLLKDTKWLSQRCWVLRRFVLFYISFGLFFRVYLDFFLWFRHVRPRRRKLRWPRKSLFRLMPLVVPAILEEDSG